MFRAYNPGDVEEVNVVYVGHGGRLPARVRALIDFLADEVDLDDAPELLDEVHVRAMFDDPLSKRTCRCSF